jgi:hypothetical protein
MVAVLLAALLLSGCFVVSQNLPKGDGPIADERLVGAWRGVEADGDEADAFLHILKPDGGKPLTLVWVEDRSYQVYEVRTMRIGAKNVFAATIIEPRDAEEKELPRGHYLGFYELKGADQLAFTLLDAEKVGKLIESGKVKGVKPPRKYDMATLTGSPAELARFLASPDADAARVDEPAYLRRIAQAK